jgi:Domain of Unknown Function with PDB structure (DUF3857)
MNRHRNVLPARIIKFLVLSALFCSLSLPANAAEEWQPISPDELKLTSEPKAPGAPAIFLYRQVDRDDTNGRETTYERIKVLTEEGRKYANVEIPFLKGRDNIKEIKARTIQPDGSVASLDGKIYEKTIVKAKGVKLLSKTFTMPDVHVGSIIEYRFTNEIQFWFVYDSYWLLSSNLFTERASFSLKSEQSLPLRLSWPNGLPEGTQAPKEDHGTIRLETRNVPAFQVEDYMPPERELKYRVDFVYQSWNDEKDPVKYWEKYGRARFRYNEEFVNKRKAMEEALATIVQPGDDAQTKLQKIYARVQQFRNFSFEREKTEQEAKRDKRRDIRSVDDIWKQKGGDGDEINYLFVALVRAAGMDASYVDVSTRDSYFFKPEMMNLRQLNNGIVRVQLAGKDLFFDPGTLHMPFGLLPWHKTNVKALLASKDGGTWIEIPRPSSDVTKIERRANLQLAEDGTLEGKLIVTYSGLEAVEVRHDGDEQDETTRKKLLEDAAREAIPAEADVTLVNQPDWTGSSPTFVAEFTIKVHEWISSAGRRQIMPVALFSAGERHVFEHVSRTHPVYFHYGFAKSDDVKVVLPQGWKVVNLPAPADQNQTTVAYTCKAEEDHGIIHISRMLRMDVLAVTKSHYPALRQFFEFVRSNDEMQIVVQPSS